MSILIKGMEMPTTSGLFLVGVDSSCGKDETVITVRRMLGSRDMCLDVGAYNIIPVPPHGRLIEESKVLDIVSEWCPDDDGSVGKVGDLREMLDDLEALPTIIPAEEGE